MTDGPPSRTRDLRTKVVEITRNLRMLSGSDDLNCCVMALSQMSRGIEHREGRKPRLSDLKESGSLEEDPDIVIFTQKNKNAEQMDPFPVDMTVAKNRSGPTGLVMRFLMYGKQYRLVEKTDRSDMPI